MNTIKITDNREEMVQIGKKIVELKLEIYTDRMQQIIMATIDSNMPAATTKEKQEMFYQSVYDYWMYGFNISEEFYYDVGHKTHVEKLAYINNKNRLVYINHLNDKKDAYLLDDKFEAYKRLKPYYKRDVVQIKSEEDYEAFFAFIEKHPIFVAKPSALWLGYGVHIVDISQYPEKHELFGELLRDAVTMKDMRRNGGIAGTVLEEIIEQADSMSVIHPQSCNTVRITTLRVDGKVTIYRPWFKIGAHGNFVTSAAQGALCAGIDLDTGIVDTAGYDEHGIKFEYHPQTNVRICGFKIPEWDNLLKTALEIAEYFPSINYIGWDFALTPHGWCIMEGNYAGEFMWQLIYERGMRKEFENIIKWKPSETYWWQQ